MNQKAIAWLLLILTSIIAYVTLDLGQQDLIKIINKVGMVSLYWVLCMVYITFYGTRRFNVDEAISDSADGLSRYVNGILIGTALVFAIA